MLFKLANNIKKKFSEWFYSGITPSNEANELIEWLIPKYKDWIKNHLSEIQDDLFTFNNITSNDLNAYLNSNYFFEHEFIEDNFIIIKSYLIKHIPVNELELNDPSITEWLIDMIAGILENKKIAYNDRDIKQLLHNLITNRIAQFNKITGKQYTEESLQQKLSELICGYLYMKINNNYIQAVNKGKDMQGKYSVLRSLNYLRKELLNSSIINDQFCQEHFNCSLDEFNKYGINTNNYTLKQLILNNDYTELENFARNIIIQQIKEYTEKAHGKRNKYLLELDNDDKIGQFYGEIDYDPHTVQFRDAPIVVYKDFTDANKDKILIGKFNEAHIDCIRRIDKSIFDKSKGYISECYYYEPSAFIDKTNGKYNIDEVAKILKADSRIEKVYLSPGMRGGALKRLAKLF